MTIVAAAILLGLVGSGHCAFMCGPLVVLAGASGRSWPHRWAGVASYHAGRIGIYAAIGAILGVVGQQASAVGFGRALAVGAGTLLMAGALGSWRHRAAAERFGAAARFLTGSLRRLGAWLHAHRVGGPMTAGALNGLLPCGLIYAAAGAAAGLGRVTESMTFMGAFGVGTMPALVVLGLSRGAIARTLSSKLRRLAPLALALVGVLLIVRGVAPLDRWHEMPIVDHVHTTP